MPAVADDRRYICLVLVRSRIFGRRKGAIRVIHLHWPRADIVNCAQVRKVVREHEQR